MTLDFVAKRYGKLPSEILKSGSNLDLYVAELSVGYQNYQAQKARGEQPVNKSLSTEELQDRLNRHKAWKEQQNAIQS